MQSEDALTAEDVAAMLQVSRSSVYKLVKKDELASYYVGRKLRFTMADVENYIARSRQAKAREIAQSQIAAGSTQGAAVPTAFGFAYDPALGAASAVASAGSAAAAVSAAGLAAAAGAAADAGVAGRPTLTAGSAVSVPAAGSADSAAFAGSDPVDSPSAAPVTSIPSASMPVTSAAPASTQSTTPAVRFVSQTGPARSAANEAALRNMSGLHVSAHNAAGLGSAHSAAQPFVLAGNDIVGDIISNYLGAMGVEVTRIYEGSYNALVDVYRGRAHAALSHLYDGQTKTYNKEGVARLMPGVPLRIIRLVGRRQGFIVAKGNPKNLRKWADLLKPGVRLINRERGCGSRILLDQQLAQLGQTAQVGYAEAATQSGQAVRPASAIRSGRASSAEAARSASAEAAARPASAARSAGAAQPARATRPTQPAQRGKTPADPYAIEGYHREAKSGLAMASFVARGAADVGIGVERTFHQVEGVDFIPLQDEWLDLVVALTPQTASVAQAITKLTKTTPFRQEVSKVIGYNVSQMGKIV